VPLDLRPRSDVVSRRLGDEVVLVNLRTNRIYSLNRTGARLWELLVEQAERSTIEATMLEEFDVDPSELHNEIDKLLGELAQAGLVDDGTS